MRLKTIKSVKNLKGKRVLLRVDFNVPVIKGRVADDTRIQRALPTIKYLLKRGAKVILASHLGRPKGKIDKKYSLKSVYRCLKSKVTSYKLQVTRLRFVDDYIGLQVEKAIEKMKPGKIILLENLRFYSGEEENDKKFARELASLADIYVNDAFASSHRAHASVAAITRYLPSYAGFLLEEEIKNLSQVLKKPARPFVVVMGGIKVSTKIATIKNLARISDKILIGGALANNFFKAAGYNIGSSVYEIEMLGVTKKLLKEEKIILPVDAKVKQKIKNKKQKTQIKNVKINELSSLTNKSFLILDVGSETIKLFSNYIKNAKMIIWNGPLGYFEKNPFDRGTKSIAQAILTNKKARIIIGGGETISVLTQLPNYPITQLPNVFISTGGGATLEFLSGKKLPGIKPLIKKLQPKADPPSVEKI